MVIDRELPPSSIARALAGPDEPVPAPACAAADNDALSLRDELAAARDEVGAGRAAYGEPPPDPAGQGREPGRAGPEPSPRPSRPWPKPAPSPCSKMLTWSLRSGRNFPVISIYIAKSSHITAANFASLASLHGHPLGQSRTCTGGIR